MSRPCHFFCSPSLYRSQSSMVVAACSTSREPQPERSFVHPYSCTSRTIGVPQVPQSRAAQRSSHGRGTGSKRCERRNWLHKEEMFIIRRVVGLVLAITFASSSLKYQRRLSPAPPFSTRAHTGPKKMGARQKQTQPVLLSLPHFSRPLSIPSALPDIRLQAALKEISAPATSAADFARRSARLMTRMQSLGRWAASARAGWRRRR